MRTYVISLDDSRESWETLYRSLQEEPPAGRRTRPSAEPLSAPEWPAEAWAMEALAWIHGMR